MIDPGPLLLVVAAVAAGFIAKGMTGIGGPIFAIPVLAAFTSLEHSAAVIAIPGLVANLILIWQFRHREPEVRRILVPLIGVGALGTAGGSWLLVHLDDRLLSGALGVLVIVYVARQSTGRPFTISERRAIQLTYPIGAVGGALHGATGISAPAFATYLHAIRIEREQFVFSVSAIFGLLGAVQIVAIGVFGGYDTERAVAGVAALVPMAVGLPIGTRIGRRITARGFDKAVLALLGLAAIRLCWSAFG